PGVSGALGLRRVGRSQEPARVVLLSPAARNIVTRGSEPSSNCHPEGSERASDEGSRAILHRSARSLRRGVAAAVCRGPFGMTGEWRGVAEAGDRRPFGMTLLLDRIPTR